MSRLMFVLLSLSIFLAACSRAPEQEAQPPAAAEQAPPPAAQPEAAAPAAETAAPAASAQATDAPKRAATQTSRPATPISRSAESRPGSPAASAAPVVPPTKALEAPAAPAPPPAPRFASLPAGTRVSVRLNKELNSDVNKSGEQFETTLDHDLAANGQVIASRGSTVIGKLVSVKQAGRVEGLASMAITLTEIRTAGEALPVRTNTLTFEAEATKKQDAVKVGAGAGIGAAIGAIAGGGKGAAIGAAIGGGAGTATVLATRGKAVTFPVEHKLNFELRDEVKVRID